MLTTITIGSANAPDVKFESLLSPLSTIESQTLRVLSDWTMITGLNWGLMPRRSELEVGGTRVLKVSHPVDNRGEVTIFWQEPK